MQKIITYCAKGARCKLWKECEECAKIRQARISNVAEQGSMKSPYLTYAVVRPIEGDNFPAEKAKIIKAVSRVAEGGIWTVETGKHTGLHTNLVIGSSERFDPKILYENVGVESHIWTNTNVNHKDVRNIASYSSKAEGMPKKGEYKGHYYGSFGNWKQPLAVAAKQRINPHVAMVAIEQMLINRGVPEPEAEYMIKPSGKEKAGAMIERISENQVLREKLEIDKERHESANKNYLMIQRSLAVLADEIELNGLAYCKYMGIVGKKELAAYGIKDLT